MKRNTRENLKCSNVKVYVDQKYQTFSLGCVISDTHVFDHNLNGNQPVIRGFVKQKLCNTIDSSKIQDS